MYAIFDFSLRKLLVMCFVCVLWGGVNASSLGLHQADTRLDEIGSGPEETGPVYQLKDNKTQQTTSATERDILKLQEASWSTPQFLVDAQGKALELYPESSGTATLLRSEHSPLKQIPGKFWISKGEDHIPLETAKQMLQATVDEKAKNGRTGRNIMFGGIGLGVAEIAGLVYAIVEYKKNEKRRKHLKRRQVLLAREIAKLPDSREYRALHMYSFDGMGKDTTELVNLTERMQDHIPADLYQQLKSYSKSVKRYLYKKGGATLYMALFPTLLFLTGLSTGAFANVNGVSKYFKARRMQKDFDTRIAPWEPSTAVLDLS